MRAYWGYARTSATPVPEDVRTTRANRRLVHESGSCRRCGNLHVRRCWMVTGTLVPFVELFVLLHLAPFLGALRVEPFHVQLLLAGELRKVADEGDQVPARALALLASVSPGGHAGEPNAVLDDVEQLTVGELLRARQPQIRRPWIEVAAYLRPAAPVVCMADRAMIREVGTASNPHFIRGGHRAAKLPERARDAHPPQLACHGGLDGRRLDLALIPPRSSSARPPTFTPSTRMPSTATAMLSFFNGGVPSGASAGWCQRRSCEPPCPAGTCRGRGPGSW